MSDEPQSDLAGATDAVVLASDDDLAAEPDADEPAPEDDGAPDEDDEDEHTGVCRGGPYDGRTVYCRYPQGFLLVHRQRNLVWIYDAAGDEYVARGAPLLLDDDKRWQTVEDGDFDVIAYDDGPVP